MRAIRRADAAGELPAAAALFMAPRKPVEELYELEQDPHEINNLAGDPAHRERLERMRAVHLDWMRRTQDWGLIPEAEIEIRERKLGTRYDNLRQTGGAELVRLSVATSPLAPSGPLRPPQPAAVLRPRVAAGRNLFIGVIVGSVGLVGHAVQGQVSYPLLVLMGASAMVGSYYGAKLTGKVSLDTLVGVMGVVMLAVGALLVWQAWRV